jgi:NADPH:quinone reductase-like Zn-dependent oxidoreductase
MRAAVIHAAGEAPLPGGHPDPVPTEGRALVAVSAAPISPLDVLAASGTSYFGAPAVPYVPGVQGVGRVVRADGRDGPRVFFTTTAGTAPGDGALAARCAPSTDTLVELPDGVDDAVVASLGLSAVAAWHALVVRAGLTAGERVLVLGVGAVGQVGIGVAAARGAGAVVAAARSGASRDRAVARGATAVAGLTTTDPTELAAAFREALGDSGADVVLDGLGGAPATAAARVLAPGGRMVHLGYSAGATFEIDSALLRSRSASVLGHTNAALSATEVAGALREVLALAASGAVAVDHEVVPLDGVTAAWRRQADGTARARQVVTPG